MFIGLWTVSLTGSMNRRNINRSVRSLRANVSRTSRSNNRSNSNAETPWSALFLSLFTLALIIFMFAFLFHWLVQRQADETEVKVIGAKKHRLVDRYRRAPRGVVGPGPTPEAAPVSMNGWPAPISGEYGGDITSNKYLTLYGNPDAPGFTGYGPWDNYMRSPGEYNYAPYPSRYSGEDRYSTRRPGLGDYYSSAELRGIPRYRLNEYISRENKYIRDVNRRVRQINDWRMYSPKFVRNKAQLAELRDFERKMANRVHREAARQPNLSDSTPYM